jgi:hypothetical protein
MTHGPHLGEVCTHYLQWLLSTDWESALVVVHIGTSRSGFGWTKAQIWLGLDLFEVTPPYVCHWHVYVSGVWYVSYTYRSYSRVISKFPKRDAATHRPDT